MHVSVPQRLFLIVGVVLALAAPAYAQTFSELTQDDVDAALVARNDAAGALAETTARFEKAVVDEEFSQEKIAELSRSISDLELEIGDKQVAVLRLVRDRYMQGGTSGTERLFAAQTFEDLPIQSEYFKLMSDRDLSVLRGLEIAEQLRSEFVVQMEDTLVEQTALVAEITVLRDEILATLEKADSDYNAIAAAFQVQEEERRRRAEEERRKAAEERARQAAAAAAAAASAASTSTTTTTVAPSSGESTTTTAAPVDQSTTTTTAPTTTTTKPPPPPPVVTDGKTCPVNAATSFSDTWGEPRSGGRVHKGVDMVAVRNAPLVAIESGVITRTSNSSLGGLSIYLAGSSGSRYYYAHLENFADGVVGGLVVSVGDTIGFNGSSGNAPDWLPHLHFQYAPPGLDWVNPYPLVKALCG